MGALRRLALVVGVGWAAGLVVNRSLRRVTGDSMRPTLAADDLVLTAPATLVRARRGDIVMAATPAGTVTKRLVALPGERVLLSDGHLAIDGVWQDEPYALTADDGEQRLPAAEGYVLLGDHRRASTDSRAFGRIPAPDRVALARVRPWRWLRGTAPSALGAPRERPAARLLVLDPDDHVLLFRVTDKDRPDRSWWETPGGGVRPRESTVDAARRELREELGRADVEPVALGEERRRTTTIDGAAITKVERFFAVRVPDRTVDRAGWTAQELAEILQTRWWTLDELAAAAEPDVPGWLAALAERAAATV